MTVAAFSNRARARQILADMERARAIAEATTHSRAIRLPLIGGIGAEWAERGLAIKATDVAAALRRDRHAPVYASLSSPGGSVSEARRIHDELRNHRGVTVAHVARRCHSAAGAVLIAAEHRTAAPKARFLLHPAAFTRDGIFRSRLDATALRALADEADWATEEMVRMYERTCSAPPGWFAAQIADGREIGTWAARMAGMIHEIEGLPIMLQPAGSEIL